ncbi:DUF2255 family protein [Streptomyces monashensis]|uniref:DUF2255 family protein n=1 Tax=Streptomyces monashensis TaxID=1678012 RepID=UPI0034064FAA
MAWPDDQLRRVDKNEDFKVVPFREDGATPGSLIWVWAVVVDDGVFVRTANPLSRRFAAAPAQQRGIVESDGARHTARFEHVTNTVLRGRVDAAFTWKYEADPDFSPDMLHRSQDHIVRITPICAKETGPDDEIR